jgi:hypothetical protein
VNCPHCGAKLNPDLANCLVCNWKIRLSEILVQPLQKARPAATLPASDIYYLFADRFLEPVSGPLLARQMEQPICDRSPVPKDALALGLCRVAFISLAVSGHLVLQTVSRQHLALSRTRTVVATPRGPYKVATGSLEALILDGIYDRRQGLSVDETILKLIGFWFDGDPYEWILRIVKQHLMASSYATPPARRIERQHLPQLESQMMEVRTLLDEFALAQPGLVAALWDSVRHALDGKRG